MGAGFGGLAVVQHLRRAPAAVTLVDRHNFHLFTPLLYEVGTALLDPSEIAYPIRGLLRRSRNADFRLAKVIGVDLTARRADTTEGPLFYDYLVLSAGSANNFFGMRGAADRCFALKDLGEALALRNQVLQCFEEAAWTEDEARRRTLMSFVVIGGGPSGVEFAGALTELVHLVLRKDFPRLDLDEVRVHLLEAAPHLLGAFAPTLRESAAARLRRIGVDVRLGTAVDGIEEAVVRLADGTSLEAATVVWTAGVQAAPLAAALGVPTGRAGRVPVLDTLQLEGHPEVYVIGDMALVMAGDQPLPQLAGVAQQQGKAVAANLRRQIGGEVAVPFSYFDRGTMATIGRNAAVVDIRGLRLKGFIGWITWLLVHLLLLVSFRNRLLVMASWAYDYFFYDRPVRLLLRADRETREQRQ